MKLSLWWTKRKALSHYKRMIKWVKTQPLMDKPDRTEMKDNIHESWFGYNCAYCAKYDDVCRDCILYKLSPTEGYSCCEGLWLDMNRAQTWHEWLYWAEQVYKFIQTHGN